MATRPGHDEGVPIVEKVLRTAAFGGSRGVEEPVSDGGAEGVDPMGRWLEGVVCGACGRYAAATALLEPLSRHRDAVVASLAASALASHRRQLGGHAAALRLDGLALRRAVEAEETAGSRGRRDDPDGLDGAGALADALLGLAADHLGLGRLAASEVLLTRAGAVVAASGCWRAETRLGWVRAELALASGRAADAISPAKHALATAEHRGAQRHIAKSSLVLAAALVATGEREGAKRARQLASEALSVVERNGWRSLIWPALLLLADLEPERAFWNRSRVTTELSVLLASTDPVGRRLARDSLWVPI